jgi:GNAT superfamily N-acetyltransferase
MTPRIASEAEVAELVALINLAFQPERAFVTGDRIEAREVADLMTEGCFLVIDGDDGRPAAAVYTAVHAERGYLGLLSVAPGRQRGGLGRALVAAAESRCRDAGCTVMDLRVVNVREELPPYYRALGYRESGSEPFPEALAHRLLRPVHLVIMSRPLRGAAMIER